MILLNMIKLLRSFRYAWSGLWFALKNEQSFRAQLFLAVVAFILMLILPLVPWERIVILVVIFLVLSLELINTTAEKIIDLFRPEITQHAKMIKDLMAAAVLVASLGALIIGCLIFLPKIIALFQDFV